MALTNQPYLPLYVRDWLTSNKLKMCSPGAHGLMINIMCVMHKEEEYGMILLKQKLKQSDDECLNFANHLSKLISFSKEEIYPLLNELLDERVLKIVGDKLVCKRMVEDAELSKIRSTPGSKGGRSTQSKNRELAENFAKAKIEANAVNATENDIANASATANVNANANDFARKENSTGEIDEDDVTDKYFQEQCEEIMEG